MVLILIKEKKGAPEGEDEVTESEVPRYYFNCLPVQVVENTLGDRVENVKSNCLIYMLRLLNCVVLFYTK